MGETTEVVSQPYGNQAVADSFTASADPDGESEPSALVPQVKRQLLDHSQAVDGLSSTVQQLPEGSLHRAASILQQTSLTASMLAEDLAEHESNPEEGGALVDELEVLLAALVDGTLLVDAYRMLAEETYRLRILRMAPAVVGLFGAPVVIQPALVEYYALLHKSFDAGVRMRAGVQEAGEAALQVVIQLGVSAAIDGAILTFPVAAPALVIGDTLIGNSIDDALGSSRSTLALDLAGAANQLSGDADMAKALGDALQLGDSVLSDDLLGQIGIAVDLADALAEMGDGGLRAAQAFREMQELGPQIIAARAALGDTIARVQEVLSPVVQSVLRAAADTAHDVAAAAQLVDQTEAELGGLF
ncbi:MAG: hypothetical protein ABMA64_29600 [Myxococcota bacterium]